MSNPILIAVENACFNLAYSASLQASQTVPEFPDVTIYNGLDNTTKTGSCVICSAVSAREMYHGTGIYTVNTNIQVKEQHSDTEVSNRGILSGVIFETFLCTGSINNLNNQGANASFVDTFIVDNVNTTEGKAWVQTLSLDMIAILT